MKALIGQSLALVSLWTCDPLKMPDEPKSPMGSDRYRICFVNVKDPMFAGLTGRWKVTATQGGQALLFNVPGVGVGLDRFFIPDLDCKSGEGLDFYTPGTPGDGMGMNPLPFVFSVEGLNRDTKGCAVVSVTDPPTAVTSNGDDPNMVEVSLKRECKDEHNPVFWISNSEEGTVSRIDSYKHREIGRFLTGPGGKGGNSLHSDSDPSRLSASLNSDVVVANRASYYGANPARSAAIRIAAYKGDCVDRNKDMVIETATGSTPLEWDKDECVLWKTPLPNETARGVAFGRKRSERGDGEPRDVFIGLWNTQQIAKLDAATGAIVARFPVAPVKPYGLAVDKDDRVWALDPGEKKLVKLDPNTGETTFFDTPSCEYGISTDSRGHIYISGKNCLARLPYGATPRMPQWQQVTLPGVDLAKDAARGLGIDNSNRVWIADTLLGLFRVDASDPLALGTPRLIPQAEGHTGVVVDLDSFPWLISNKLGKAFRVDPMTNLVTHEVAVGLKPYVYSDMSQYQLRNGTLDGTYFHTFLGDCAAARWTRIDWRLAAPAGTLTSIRVRWAGSKEGLARQPFTRVLDRGRDLSTLRLPVHDEVDATDSRYLQVEFSLATGTPGVTPFLPYAAATYHCR